MAAARGYNLVEMLLTAGQGGRPGTKIEPKGVVIHWTANTNPGADARANRDYFQNHPANKVAAHYIVDDQVVVFCVPEDEMAYHVGAKRYNPEALRLLSSYPNNCTIGIEMCVNQDADFSQTYRNTVSLAADILSRHGWGVHELWRHFDITGKECPRFFVHDIGARDFGFASAATAWQRFKSDVLGILSGKPSDQAERVTGMYKDMAGHWAREDVEEATSLGLVRGMGDGTFGPDEGLTRVQGTVLALRGYKQLKARIEALENQVGEMLKLTRG
ncbi:MAG: N-acetylmuramoyl-L-alanine amidase [Firmicutes bacterium]|nr:N-acetylmuramoyl-L-alanine amidase [Bacillota bacterium]